MTWQSDQIFSTPTARSLFFLELPCPSCLLLWWWPTASAWQPLDSFLGAPLYTQLVSPPSINFKKKTKLTWPNRPTPSSQLTRLTTPSPIPSFSFDFLVHDHTPCPFGCHRLHVTAASLSLASYPSEDFPSRCRYPRSLPRPSPSSPILRQPLWEVLLSFHFNFVSLLQ